MGYDTSCAFRTTPRSLRRDVTGEPEALQGGGRDSGGGDPDDDAAPGPDLSKITGRIRGPLGFTAVATAVLLFFLLASGDLFLRKLAHVLPQFQHRRKAVVIAKDIEQNLSRYFVTMTAIRLGVGLAVGGAMWLLGMPNPILCGGWPPS